MKSTTFVSLPALTLMSVLALPVGLEAQPQQPRYIVVDLGKPGFGGPVSFAFGINNVGRVTGQAMLPNGNFHAFLSGVGRTLYDLGTLGGPNAGGSAVNSKDAVALVSDTATKDPLGEDYCGFGTNLICRAAVWQGGLVSLAPPGGNSSFAEAINSAGQVAGWGETSVQDPTCRPPQVLRSQAVVWGPGRNEIHPLPPLPGDTVSFGLAINDLGQVVGGSGTCANTPLAPFPVGPHAILWVNGTPKDLGSLTPGGSALNVGASINNLGMVVGGSRLAGAIHTYLWTAASGMQDLGLLETDLGNLPGGGMGINNNGQVVGMSCVNDALCDMSNPEFMSRAYLWQNGKMMDLNSLVVGGAPLYLVFACQINDAGEIVGFGATATGDIHAFEAHLIPSPAPRENVSFDEPRVTGPVALTEAARRVLQRRMSPGAPRVR